MDRVLSLLKFFSLIPICIELHKLDSLIFCSTFMWTESMVSAVPELTKLSNMEWDHAVQDRNMAIYFRASQIFCLSTRNELHG